MKNRVSAAIIAIIGGLFGLHLFYLGKSDKAKNRILFTILGLSFVSAILALIEAKELLCMDQAEFDKEYNGGVCSDVATILNSSSGTGCSQKEDDLPDF